jgi:hypothetical protein
MAGQGLIMAARKKSPTKKAPRKKTERNLTRELSTLLAKRLLPDLKERAKEPPVAAALAVEFETERQRTADSFDTWMSHKLEQVGVAWILSCVFVRTLEDRGYMTHRRLAGEGAQDAEHLFFDLFPSLTSRDYLLAVFRELSHLPGAEDVLGPKRNVAWRLSPSSEVVRELLGVFRETDAEGQLVWGFGGGDTRFLGDLYQEISEGVRERFALLQTPEFVEEFILDLTLDPAIAEFGLETVRLLDPTCGSGHFLLGAFRRLFEARQRHAPGLPVKEHATAALAQVAGADINPYAVAIARFRLVLAYLEAAQIEKLRDAPRLSTNVATVDSLLVGANQRTLPLAAHSENAAAWGESHWQLEDRDEALRVFRRQYYHAIVGNPPYITCKDQALSAEYRKLYRSCYGDYALAAPFAERFFQLACDAGYVGMINANTFMRREFGKKLVEEVLSQYDLDRVIDISQAHIPGHGTPPVLLFGRRRAPIAAHVRVVHGRRGDPETPSVPARGLVWSSIKAHFDEPDYEDPYISVADLPRDTLSRWPWNVAGGGAGELAEQLEERCQTRLTAVIDDMGRTTVVGEDDIWVAPRGTWNRRGLGAHAVPLVTGKNVRDWAVSQTPECLYPYDRLGGTALPEHHRITTVLWPWRAILERRTVFGKQIKAHGRPWWEHLEHYSQRLKTPSSIVFARDATHNHFAFDRGGSVFKTSAPVIKIDRPSGDDAYWALLAFLNSSTACFLLKQVLQPKGSTAVNKNHPDPARATYEFGARAVARLPVPSLSGSEGLRLRLLANALDRIASTRVKLLSGTGWRDLIVRGEISNLSQLKGFLVDRWQQADGLKRKLIALQEEVDWTIYRLVGWYVGPSVDTKDAERWGLGRGYRPFEVVAGRRGFVRDRGVELTCAESDCDLPEGDAPAEIQTVISARVHAIRESAELALLEDYRFKRLWRDTAENMREVDYRLSFDHQQVLNEVCDEVERLVSIRGTTVHARALASELAKHPWLALAMECLGHDLKTGLAALLKDESIPFSSGWRYSESGHVKWRGWCDAWDRQRLEDRGDIIPMTLPEEYESSDFSNPASFWRLRGKLDVPKERFISYPGAEKDDDPSPLYGWAGWDHLQQATALAGLYHERKTEEAWPPDRLVPLLAGLLELVPWLKQWHNAPTDDLGGEGAGDWYDRYVAVEARSLGKTLDDLRAWRPTSKTGRSRTATR